MGTSSQLKYLHPAYAPVRPRFTDTLASRRHDKKEATMTIVDLKDVPFVLTKYAEPLLSRPSRLLVLVLVLVRPLRLPLPPPRLLPPLPSNYLALNLAQHGLFRIAALFTSSAARIQRRAKPLLSSRSNAEAWSPPAGIPG